MKMCFFINPSQPQSQTLKTKLKELGYMVLQTQNTDEIDQAGKQCQQLILFFDDSKFAYKFLKENRWNGFRLFSVLLLLKKPVLSPDNQRMLASVALEVFGIEEETQLLEKIKKFEEKKEDDLDIEFSIHKELEENQ